MAVLVAVCAFAVYWASPVRLETDSYYTVFTAHTLLRHGTVDLRDYRAITDRRPGFQIEAVGDARYYRAPLVATLTTVPVVAVVELFDGHALADSLRHGHVQPYDGIVAAVITAATVALVFLVARRRSPRRWVAISTAAAFAFGTQAYSTASRTTWMHGPSLLLLAFALYCAARIHESARWWYGVGAALALAYFARPSNAVVLAAFALWALTRGRRPIERLATGAIAVAAAVVALNLASFGVLLQPYFQANRLALSSTTAVALLGNLVSPSRGELVYVPLTLVAVWGVVLTWRRGRDAVDVAVFAAAVGSWVVASMFPHWWGGWGYGPRLLTDAAPFVAWFLVPAFDALAVRGPRSAPVSRPRGDGRAARVRERRDPGAGCTGAVDRGVELVAARLRPRTLTGVGLERPASVALTARPVSPTPSAPSRGVGA
jgi:hypothetical protein